MLEKIQSNKKVAANWNRPRKDLSAEIRLNEEVLSRNQHKIMRLDEAYKHSVMRDLKQETRQLWRMLAELPAQKPRPGRLHMGSGSSPNRLLRRKRSGR